MFGLRRRVPPSLGRLAYSVRVVMYRLGVETLLPVFLIATMVMLWTPFTLIGVLPIANSPRVIRRLPKTCLIAERQNLVATLTIVRHLLQNRPRPLFLDVRLCVLVMTPLRNVPARALVPTVTNEDSRVRLGQITWLVL